MLHRQRDRLPGSTGPTLDRQRNGAALRLVAVDGDRGRARRVMELGLRPGQVVTVTHTRGRGGVVVACDAGRVAVGRELARHIRVDEIV